MVIESIKLEKAVYKSNSLAALPIQSPSIKFNDIEFGYKENSSILENISFDICYGEIVGLVGPSGEGKTTLIRLLLSLIKEHKGSKCIISNGESFSISPETRDIISYVPQGNTLFSGTIRENLLFGNLEASDEELGAALKSAFAWDFVDKLPEKLYTKIGEKGLGLSEGQAQRLAIARAFLRKTPILILDEATSSLDTDTEIKILRSISTLEHKPTTIIITHRLSALSICNRILKLENGCLHEIESYSKEESAAEIN